MAQTYKEAIEWINGRLKFGINPGLHRMEWLMERLNHPERRIKTVHIGGTNGKGSTVCYLRNILQEAEYNVGTFISPYFEQFNERISVNGIPICDEDLLTAFNAVQPLVLELEKTDLGSPTEFEIITAIALYYFAYVNIVDIVIMEVGLGGRLDSTNVIYPLISIITNIGLDHTAILGNTIDAIAYEKAGIIKPGIPVVTTVEQAEALAVINEKAKKENAKVYLSNKEFSIISHSSVESGELFSITTPFLTLHDLKLKMKGYHQVKNASLAVMAAVYLQMYYSFLIGEEHIRKGLEKSIWIGRFEQISLHPHVIIDGAHNPEGIQSLIATMASHIKEKQVYILFSALGDKDLDNMIQPLSSIADQIIFTTFNFSRAIPAKALYLKCPSSKKQYDENWQNAIEETLKELPHDAALIITGSLYFLSKIRPYLLKKLSK